MHLAKKTVILQLKKRILILPMQKIYLIGCALCLLLLTGCKEEEKLQPEPVRKDMTVVVYIAAENSLSRFYHSDLAEMESVADQIPLDCNFVVYVDSSTLPAIYLLNGFRFGWNGFAVGLRYRF